MPHLLMVMALRQLVPADIPALTPEIAREFIGKTAVRGRPARWKKKNDARQVDVCFNSVGKG